jgi:dsRNA-specific ribonuclease
METPQTSLDLRRQKAWIGDAVLELYARRWVLQHKKTVDAELKTRLTCNQFLNCLGNPTAVEAEIGLIFEQAGLEAAFSHIQQHLEPLFHQQQKRRGR